MVRRGRRKAVAYAGFKSTEGEHERAVETLQAALGARAEPGQLKALRAIIKEKDSVSYQGIYYTMAEARNLVEKLNGFAEWAEGIYERRP